MQAIGINTGATYYKSGEMFHGSLEGIMGTRFEVLVIGKNEQESREIWNEIVQELRRLDAIFNRFDKDSEASRINREATTGSSRVSPEMLQALESCRDYHARTKGLFDITLKDFSSVEIDTKNSLVVFTKRGISLDFGGYAKGYALSKIKGLLLKNQVEHCFVDFGNSSILGIGHHPHGDSWKVSVRDPYQPGAILGELSLQDQALSVSGNSPSYSGHIVRPDSQLATNEREVVSVVSDDPLDAEVLSTVFMMTNEEEKEAIKKEFAIEKVTEYSIE